MGYSIFQNTMVDMTYPQIEEEIKKGACALLPISVVEEHGPHLCTGTDIYLTQAVCVKIKQQLNAMGKPVIIAPSFYWGINSITDSFVGSFTISSETMEALLLDILANLKKWGIHKIFMLNFHGDYVHIRKIAEIAKKAYIERKTEAYFINSKSTFMQFGITEEVPYLLNVPLNQNLLSSMGGDSIDIHAGAAETSWMMLDYEELADPDIAKQLKATNLSMDDLRIWLHGGNSAKEITPSGYCGNPANIDLDAIQRIEKETSEAFASYIYKVL